MSAPCRSAVAFSSAPPRVRVTVIIPTYERPRFLAEALRSVLGQTRPVDEIIVVDDCSSRGAWRSAQQACRQSERIALRRLETHRGAAAARNRGLDLASGDYVVFLDDDDLLEPRMIERSLAALEADATLDAIVCGRAVHWMPGSGPVFELTPASRRLLERRPFSTILRRGFSINSCFVRRSAIGALRFPEDLTYGEDQYFWLALAGRGRRFTSRSEPDAIVRRHAHNTTKSRAVARREIRLMYEKLLAGRMARRRDEHVLLSLKLSYSAWASGSAAWREHLARAAAHPVALAREIVAYGARAVPDPIGFVRHYFLS